jgi:hypothetical protein
LIIASQGACPATQRQAPTPFASLIAARRVMVLTLRFDPETPPSVALDGSQFPQQQNMKIDATSNGPRIWLTVVSGLIAAAAPLHAADYKEVILADKPFVYYRLNEASNATPAVDELGNHHGIYEGAPAVGVAGAIIAEPGSTAASFSRADKQCVTLTNLGDYGKSMTKGFTVEYWLKTSDATNYQVIMGCANDPGFINDFLVDIGYGKKEGRLRLYYRDDTFHRYEANFYPDGGNTKIFDNAWHLITQVYDPSAAQVEDRVRFYVDGVRQILTVFEGKGPPVSSNFNLPLTLGAMNKRGTIQDHLEGSLDEIALYKRALSPQQILNHYRSAFR